MQSQQMKPPMRMAKLRKPKSPLVEKKALAKKPARKVAKKTSSKSDAKIGAKAIDVSSDLVKKTQTTTEPISSASQDVVEIGVRSQDCHVAGGGHEAR